MGRRRTSHTAIGALALAMASVGHAGEEADLDAARPWFICLADKARSLAASPDSAEVIASAAITLCRKFEGPVMASNEQSAEAQLLRNGTVADAAEAKRIVVSIREKAWTDYVQRMKDVVMASGVQLRAKGPAD